MSNNNFTQLQPELAKLGRRLRRLRSQRGWTLEELAQRTSVSEAYISRVENGDRQPSIAVLLSFAQAYEVGLSNLFGTESEVTALDDSNLCTIIRAGSTPMQQGNGLRYTPLSKGNRSTNLHPIQVTVPTDRQGDLLYEHDGEEWLYVLSGQLVLTIADEQYVLQPGDSANFDARTPHRLSAQETDAEILLVACSDPRHLLSSYL